MHEDDLRAMIKLVRKELNDMVTNDILIDCMIYRAHAGKGDYDLCVKRFGKDEVDGHWNQIQKRPGYLEMLKKRDDKIDEVQGYVKQLRDQLRPNKKGNDDEEHK